MITSHYVSGNKCKCDQKSRLIKWVMARFLCLFCLSETDPRLFAVCWTLIWLYIVLVCCCLSFRQLFQKQSIVWEFITVAPRIWSPFYYRACFPRWYPPQMQWKVITSEEPVEWEERKDDCNFSVNWFTLPARRETGFKLKQTYIRGSLVGVTFS